MITGNPVPLKVSEITPEVEAPERVTVTDVPAEKLLRALGASLKYLPDCYHAEIEKILTESK